LAQHSICVLEMARAVANWERLVRAAINRDQISNGASSKSVTGIKGNAPYSLGNANSAQIEEILSAADEIHDQDPESLNRRPNL